MRSCAVSADRAQTAGCLPRRASETGSCACGSRATRDSRSSSTNTSRYATHRCFRARELPQMDFVYLPHPRAISWLCWRKPGKTDQTFASTALHSISFAFAARF